MYWPIGSPKVYSLTRHANPPTIKQSDDGIQVGSEVKSKANAQEKTRRGSQSTRRSSKASSTATLSGEDEDIIAIEVARGGGIFFTATRARITVWQSKPVAALAAIVRSPQSLRAYGHNVALLLRPDAQTVTIQTSHGFLVTYSLYTDPSARVYQTRVANARHNRRDSTNGTDTYRRPSAAGSDAGVGEGEGMREVSFRFRMVIRIDAGIHTAVALDEELVVATQKPPAVQCIRWAAEDTKPQTRTELFSRMPWYEGKTAVTGMTYDRSMKLAVWITNDGKAYAVHNVPLNSTPNGQALTSTFQGFCFHKPRDVGEHASHVAINPRFSLLAIARADGLIDAYVVKDYAGNISLSHQYRTSTFSTPSGPIKCLEFAPDGHSLFAASASGWSFWSVYGKVCASSFTADPNLCRANDERWLNNISHCFWIGGGSEIALIGANDDRIYVLDIARNAAMTCQTNANVSRSLLHTTDSIMIYRGHDVPDLTSLTSDVTVWQTVQIPMSYLATQWPIRYAVSSPDGRYVAVAGRRGLAHYGVNSGKWKTFDHAANEFEFSVRGGMCWFHHVLIACVEIGTKHQIRLYSREKALDYSHVLHTESLSSAAICVTTSGNDSLLVYTLDNSLLHYIITSQKNGFKLIQVGQIGFHGIIRAPTRVRAVSWLLPEDQIVYGDPAQDVTTASIIFLVDGKLILLQPSANDDGGVKYDMRALVQNAEFFLLAREQGTNDAGKAANTTTPSADSDTPLVLAAGHSLRDSLWCFDGSSMMTWPDIQDVLAAAPSELDRALPPLISVQLDFYPTSVLISKGIIHGIDAELLQRRDVDFSFYRFSARTQLFLPQILRHQLVEFNSPAALHLSRSYEHLSYFEHVLEVLLHQTLDSEVDNPPTSPDTALLPTVVSFLSSFPSYHEIIVNCTRKTELRSWRTLFANLPPVQTLFDHNLSRGKLKTASGYLLVLHAFQAESFQIHESARLLHKAMHVQDWDLCRELARFLLGIDDTGDTLRAALREASGELLSPSNGELVASTGNGSVIEGIHHTDVNVRTATSDYFSAGHHV